MNQLLERTASQEIHFEDMPRHFANVETTGLETSVVPSAPRTKVKAGIDAQDFYTYMSHSHRHDQSWALKIATGIKPINLLRGRPASTDIRATLERVRTRYARRDLEGLETTWLSRNRRNFAGQWIALQGDRLLAHSPVAAQVFAAARDVIPEPLVMQIEQEDAPFGGW